MKRRYLLLGACALTLSQLAAGCGTKRTLKVRSLKNSIYPQIVNEFNKLQPSSVLQIITQTQLEELFNILQTWKAKTLLNNSGKEPEKADLVTIGDYWLAKAIEQKLIQPIDTTKLKNWSKLPPAWQTLVRRNDSGLTDEKGKIWAAPYRWGTTVIAYRIDKFKSLGWTPKDWSDLWREELRDRISLLDNPREVIGLTLKKLGKSYNIRDLNKVPNLKEELTHLHQQTKLYSSNAYLQPLILGDTWAAVAWSGDVLPLMQSQKEIAAIVPISGTSMWVDLWVQPAANPKSDVSLAEEWIDFCLQPEIGTQISLFTQATSPVILNTNSSELPDLIRNNQIILPESEIISKSEFLFPLPDVAINQYRSLWKEIRNIK
ncbi:polyamine ABC transporter substrate-binding protein [Oscillatoriales cyanobacterium USR001]|nr:polyamine ABC transporter substrate-binding protein [Oscillatoriales cyanobacterium USR001]